MVHSWATITELSTSFPASKPICLFSSTCLKPRIHSVRLLVFLYSVTTCYKCWMFHFFQTVCYLWPRSPRTQAIYHQQLTMILTPHLTKPFQRSQYLPLLLHPSHQVLFDSWTVIELWKIKTLSFWIWVMALGSKNLTNFLHKFYIRYCYLFGS